MRTQTSISRQSGMSAIIFASVFMIILSLMAIGFATLVRNDQQEVVDKTLSYQAQYAAETAINRTVQVLKANPSTPTPATCSNQLGIANAASNAEAQVTCIMWNTSLPNINKSTLTTEPFVAPLKSGGANIETLTFAWSADNLAKPAYAGATNGALPTIQAANIPILRVTFDSPLKTFYLVPSTAGASTASLSGDESGNIAIGNCAAGVCTASVTGTGINSATNKYLSMVAYGSQATSIVITGVSGAGVPQNFVGAQAEIDANAVSKEVTKRIIARVSLLDQTWRPGFAIAADQICKNYRTDGTQTSFVFGAAADLCPN